MLIKCLTNSIEDNQKSLDNDGLDIVQGLQSYPKTLPPKYFYDDLGSELFEQICLLPEYYPTRTEAAILEEYADEIAQMTNCCELVELGSGSSTKTRFLLDAYQKIADSCSYLPIDVSGGILKASVLELQQQYPDFFIQGLLGTYEQALEHLELERTNSERSRMIFFLGSSIGNFTESECDRFLHKVACTLRKGDYFLLGTDLQKPKEILEAAYNDSQNVTAAFNLNILSHLNWRFQGDFDPNLFTHQAIYNQTENQIEMYLHCRDDHQVSLEVLDLNIQFKTGESILTEISRKFDLEVLKTQLELQGLKTLKVWTDPQKLFSLVLAQA
jgi:L-histidine N-alpha-methyltransferase